MRLQRHRHITDKQVTGFVRLVESRQQRRPQISDDRIGDRNAGCDIDFEAAGAPLVRDFAQRVPLHVEEQKIE